MCRLERQLLYAPVEEFSDIEFVVRWAGDGVDPAELAGLLARFAHHPENFSLEREFVNAPRKSIGSVENLIGSRRDAQGPRRARSHGARPVCGLVADGSTRVGRCRNVDRDLAEEFSFGVKDLNAAIAAVSNIDVVFPVDGDAMRSVQLARLASGFTPGL